MTGTLIVLCVWLYCAGTLALYSTNNKRWDAIWWLWPIGMIFAVVAGTYEGAREARREMGKWPFIATVSLILIVSTVVITVGTVGILTIIRWL